MTRMIERWFPCAEVSDNSDSGWGSGNSEATLFMWFAKRPLAQARAAMLTSLLPWPEDKAEQERLQKLVIGAMQGYSSVHDEVVRELQRSYNGRSFRVLDPFSGRGMIPVEAARYGVEAHALDYSAVATIGSHLLIDFPLRDWESEPRLPYATRPANVGDYRLACDVEAVVDEVGRRFSAKMEPFFPEVNRKRAWGYMWAVTLPCQECGRRFPLVGNLELRPANGKRHDLGQSFRIDTNSTSGEFSAVVHDGPPRGTPTRQVAQGKSRYDASGKVAVCPFCSHVHTKAVHTRLAASGQGVDALLFAADIDSVVGKRFRTVTAEEIAAASAASTALRKELPFSPILPAIPNEGIPPGNTWTVQASVYGAKTYGDMMNDRQTLGFIQIARHIAACGREIVASGNSVQYARALCGYASAVMVRKLRRSTRGCKLAVSRQGVSDVFETESSLGYSYDYFEVGLADGPGSWDSVQAGTITALRRQLDRPAGTPAFVQHDTATALPYKSGSFAAVVTDPPYDAMIDYTDASDLFYVWLKRSLSTTWPEVAVTADPYGVQEKSDEIIVKKGGSSSNDPRDRRHYDRLIAKAFSEARRVIQDDGVVTIVFGHGEIEVWQRLLTAIWQAGLVLTGSWPAKTEKGGKVGFSNIVTTLTMACRAAPKVRPVGNRSVVEAEIKGEVKKRYREWEEWGLAPTDMLMAAVGPAMEVVGRYSEVLDSRGEPVAIDRFLPLARAAVQEAMVVEIDHHPLETFDAKTRFALWWVRLFGRSIAPKSELRWQTLAASLDLDDVRDLVPDVDKGCRFVSAAQHKAVISAESSAIDVVLALGRTSEDGLAAMGAVLAASGRQPDDAYLWATATFLADRLPNSDPDSIAFTRVLRNRSGVGNAAAAAHVAGADELKERERQEAQLKLF